MIFAKIVDRSINFEILCPLKRHKNKLKAKISTTNAEREDNRYLSIDTSGIQERIEMRRGISIDINGFNRKLQYLHT